VRLPIVRNGCKSRRAYSVAEAVVALTIIILMSVVAITACYVGLSIQKNAEINLDAVNDIAGARTAFWQVCEETVRGDSSYTADKTYSVYHERIAEVLDFTFDEDQNLFASTDGRTLTFSGERGTYTYHYDCQRYTVEITLKLPDGTQEKTFSAEAKRPSGKTVCTEEVTFVG